jgi:DNA repair exonuclease SbcCD ATPase subunit
MSVHPHQETGVVGGPEPGEAEDVSFDALRQAAALAAEEATEVAGSGDDVRALACVAALDRALAEVDRLAAAVPGVVQAAFPGAAVETVLREKLAAADRATVTVRHYRTQLDELAAVEASLRRTVEEHEDLRQRVGELRRLERAAEVLPRLGEYRELIEERVAALSEPVEAAESRLAQAAAALMPLDADVLNRLAPRARELTQQAAERLAAVASAERDVADQERRLADATRREQELGDLRERNLVALAEHARADRAVLGALASPASGAAEAGEELGRVLDEIRTALADVDAQLDAVDRNLGQALRARADLIPDDARRR